MDQNLLIVDDEDRLTRSFKILFEDRGYQVETAGSGSQAISIFKQVPSKVVISDIQMEGMDGIQLMHELIKIDPCVQIIFLTAYSSIQNASDALKNRNAFEYLTKPVKDMDDLFLVTERAKKKYDLEKQLLSRKQENEKSFTVVKSIFDSMEAMIYVADINSYELIYANPKFLEVFHHNKPVKPEEKCWQVMQKNPEGPCQFCTNDRLIHSDGSFGHPYEWEFQNKENSRWYSMIDKAIEWYDNRVVRMGTAFDVTEKREHESLYRNFEKAIETSRQLVSISTLAGGVAHDFNNSLSTVIGNINLAQLSCSDNDTQKYLSNAERGIMQAKGICSKLISFAKGSGPVKTKIHIENLIRRILEKQLSDSNIQFKIESDPVPDNFHADQNQLKHAFGNILQNAVESIGGDGQIDVRIQFQESRLNNSQILITITDTGCGIPKEHLDMIFNPYFTTKPLGSKKSTGLGLSIAWSIIARHGGLIQVESTPGKGTSVHISMPFFRDIPVAENEAEEVRVCENGNNNPRERLRVLVMDDDELILDVITKLLGRLGYETFAASNGNQAIQAFQAALKDGRNIHIALLDYEIHDTPGGYLTFAELKKMDSSIKGILITGHTDNQQTKTYKKHGFSGAIEKPFSIKQLNQKIRSVVQAEHNPS